MEKVSLLPVSSATDLDTSISTLSQPLAEFLEYCELPVDNVLAPVEERRKIITSLKDTIDIIPIEDRQKSYYLSKFTISVANGLFDGAINFLWDETIRSLRNIITKFDLQYFFSVAETVASKYKNLNAESDLEAIDDYDLLDILRRIGIINNVIHKRLETVNYFRNHASAAHPNNNDITGIELLSYLEHCIKYAICGEIEHSVIKIKQLFGNIRTNDIPESDYEVISSEIIKLPIERIDDFLKSIFGLFIDPKQSETVRKNIIGISKKIWDYIPDETKFLLGSSFGVYRKNGDIERKNLVERFLTENDGLSYKDEDSIAGELIVKLQRLKSAHFGINNFYNEYPHAEDIQRILPRTGIPEAAKKDFVKVISICYVGNGFGYREGVDDRALPLYKKFIDLFTENEFKIFLNLFDDVEFIIALDRSKPKERMKKLTNHIKSKTKNTMIITALDIVLKTRDLVKLSQITEFKKSLERIH